METSVQQLQASFGRYPAISEVILDGLSCADRFRHTYLAEFHCYFAVLLRTPKIPLPPNAPWKDLGATEWSGLIERFVAPDADFSGIHGVSPFLWRAFHAAVADACHRRRLEVRVSDLLLCPLARPLDVVHSFLLQCGLSPRELIAPAMAALGEPDMEAAVEYYERLHDLLKSTYPFPVSIRDGGTGQLHLRDVEPAPGYKLYQDEKGNIHVIPKR